MMMPVIAVAGQDFSLSSKAQFPIAEVFPALGTLEILYTLAPGHPGLARLSSSAYRRYGVAVVSAYRLRGGLLALPALAAEADSLHPKGISPDLTVIIRLAQLMATPMQRAEIDHSTGQPHYRNPARLATIINQTGAVTRAEAMIGEQLGEAFGVLKHSSIDPHTRDALAYLAATLAWRKH
jgi:hypothetical protein